MPQNRGSKNRHPSCHCGLSYHHYSHVPLRGVHQHGGRRLRPPDDAKSPSPISSRAGLQRFACQSCSSTLSASRVRFMLNNIVKFLYAKEPSRRTASHAPLVRSNSTLLRIASRSLPSARSSNSVRTLRTAILSQGIRTCLPSARATSWPFSQHEKLPSRTALCR